jgi:DNA repair protein RadC
MLISYFASSIIIAHNDPSGNNKLCGADKLLTQSVKEDGELMDIQLLDHIILTKHEHFSFADEGYL